MTSRQSSKRRAVDWVRKGLAGARPPVVVASMGRAGSTLVFDALVEGMALRRFGRAGQRLGLERLVRSWAFDLTQTPLIGGVVYKTHDFPPPGLAQHNPKIVYVFGSASQAAVSVHSCVDRYGRAWVDQHFRHLRARGRFEDMWTQDVLRFEDQIDAWTQVADLDVLAVKFDALWDHERTMSDFLGVRVKLPPRRDRLAASADADVMARARSLYAALDARIAALPDVFRPPVITPGTQA